MKQSPIKRLFSEETPKYLASLDALQFVQSLRRGFLGRRFVDGLERRCKRFDVRVEDILGGVADLMDDGSAESPFWESHGNGFCKAAQSVSRNHKKIGNVAVFQAIQRAEPVFWIFRRANSQA